MLGETEIRRIRSKKNEPKRRCKERPCGKTKGENLQAMSRPKRLQRRRRRDTAGWTQVDDREARGVE